MPVESVGPASNRWRRVSAETSLARIGACRVDGPDGELLHQFRLIGPRATEERDYLAVVAQRDFGDIAGVEDRSALAGGLLPHQEIPVLDVGDQCSGRVAWCGWRKHGSERQGVDDRVVEAVKALNGGRLGIGQEEDPPVKPIGDDQEEFPRACHPRQPLHDDCRLTGDQRARALNRDPGNGGRSLGDQCVGDLIGAASVGVADVEDGAGAVARHRRAGGDQTDLRRGDHHRNQVVRIQQTVAVLRLLEQQRAARRLRAARFGRRGTRRGHGWYRYRGLRRCEGGRRGSAGRE